MTKSDLLLKAIALCGEMPADLAGCVVGAGAYAASLLTCLKKDGFITVRKKDGIRGYVLTARAKRYLLARFPNDMEKYLSGNTETNHVKSEREKRLRLHRMGRVWAFCLHTGVRVFASDKPAYPPKPNGVPADACYYGASDIKRGSDKVKGSRACGVLCTRDRFFAVYHTLDQLMKWSVKRERTMRVFLEADLYHTGYMPKADALLLGNKMDMLTHLLDSDGGIKSQLFQVDDVYDSYYYMPTDYGKLQMHLLTDRGARDYFWSLLRQRLDREDEKEYALCDGYEADGTPVYFCFELELQHLKRIKRAACYGIRQRVYCFDYQEDALSEYFGPRMEFCLVSGKKVMELLEQTD